MKYLCLFIAFILSALIALAHPAAAGAATMLPDGTYKYSISRNDKEIATSTIVVQRKNAALTIGESVSIPGTTILTQRTLDPQTFLTSSYTMTQGGKTIPIAIVGSNATLDMGGGKTQTIASPSGSPFVISDNLVAGLAQIPATVRATGAKTLTVAVVAGGFVALPASVTATGAGKIDVELQGITISLQFDPQTFVVSRIDVPAQKSAIVLTSSSPTIEALAIPPEPTPMPLPSPRYSSRDVTIVAGDGVKLQGTLTTPDAAKGRLPGFVLVHGSGCSARDEAIGPNRIFLQLANDLSNRGYAVLRYDKRSCGKSAGDFPVRDRLIADARDAIAFLRAQPGIDRKRVYVLGHSEGGELAPSIAIADGRLAGIVLMAPPAIPLDRILMYQKDETEQQVLDDASRPGAYNAWLRSSFGIDPAKTIAKVPCPILIVQGTADIQVRASDTPKLAGAAKAARRKVTVVMLDGDDHLFIKLPPGEASTGAEYFKPALLDPRLFAAIETWLAHSGS